jgi:hypothetical protein
MSVLSNCFIYEETIVQGNSTQLMEMNIVSPRITIGPEKLILFNKLLECEKCSSIVFY